MELISPVDYVKEATQPVQDWANLSGASIRNVLKRPRYMADIIYHADIIGLGSLPIVVLRGFVPHFMIGRAANQYWTMTYQSLRNEDVFMGLIKPVFFGFIISTIGCYYGLSAKGGTQGVGRATTQAVVAASVLILVADFFITRLLMGLSG